MWKVINMLKTNKLYIKKSNSLKTCTYCLKLQYGLYDSDIFARFSANLADLLNTGDFSDTISCGLSTVGIGTLG